MGIEILDSLLKNEILTEETRKELEEAIQSQILEAVEEAKTTAREETEIKVRAELAEQFVVDKEALVEALDTKAEQWLRKELNEFKDDVETYRDLEAEFAEKLVEHREKLSKTAKNDFTQLVNILDEFLEERLNVEMEELKEDIEQVKKIKFGQGIYESVKDTFEREYFNKDEIDEKVRKAETELNTTRKELTEATKELNRLKREQVLGETLSPLAGRAREVMSAILENTETSKIPEVYEQFITRVLNESVENEDKEKETKVLAENSNPEKSAGKKTVTITGDDKDAPKVITEGDIQNKLSDEVQNRLRELSGLND